MKTLTVLSHKGGSGKTTVSLSLALAARESGLKVALADLDPLRSAGEVLRARPENASLLIESTASKLFVLQHECRQKGCDLLVVDTPTAPDADLFRAVHLSDLSLAVTRPNVLDLAAVRQSSALIARAGRAGLIVLNQCPPLRDGEEPATVRKAIETLRSSGLPMADARLRSRAAYQQAFAQGYGVTEWRPDSEGAAEVRAMLAEAGNLLGFWSGGLARVQETPPGPGSPVQDLLKRVSVFAGA